MPPSYKKYLYSFMADKIDALTFTFAPILYDFESLIVYNVKLQLKSIYNEFSKN